jgi:hypothetical protein
LKKIKNFYIRKINSFFIRSLILFKLLYFLSIKSFLRKNFSDFIFILEKLKMKKKKAKKNLYIYLFIYINNLKIKNFLNFAENFFH